MEGSLKVTPERLIQASGEFGESGGRIKVLTNEMLECIHHLRGEWQGDAANTYHNKFQLLQGDMDKMYRMIQEHVEDLQEMAKQYQEAEHINLQEGQSLGNDVIL